MQNQIRTHLDQIGARRCSLCVGNELMLILNKSIGILAKMCDCVFGVRPLQAVDKLVSRKSQSTERQASSE